MTLFSRLAGASALSCLAACGGGPAPSPTAGYGADPAMPAPHHRLIPVVHVAKAGGWAVGAAPAAPPGFVVTRFAEGLDHPRQLYVLPNGDVLAALSATEPGKPRSIIDTVMAAIQNYVGASEKSPNRIVLLRDGDGDGKAEVVSTLLTGINQPFGMALWDGRMYVAATDAVWRYPYQLGQTTLVSTGEKVMDLPHGPGHWTRNLLVSRDGQKLYVSVGSASNIADGGMAREARRADILEVDPDGGHERVFASGLRNPNGMAFEPETGALWTVVNERDMLGDDTPPDYLTSIADGGFYGWPYSYWDPRVDARVKPQAPQLVARAIKPDYGLGAHTASLGLAFYVAGPFPAQYRGGAFIGQHGSWNRTAFSGYKVLFVPFKGGRPSGPPQDFLTGFLRNDGKTENGRPAGVAVDARGALLVADDVGGVVWRVAAQPLR